MALLEFAEGAVEVGCYADSHDTGEDQENCAHPGGLLELDQRSQVHWYTELNINTERCREGLSRM